MKFKILIILATLIFLSCGTSNKTKNSGCGIAHIESVILRWGGHNYRTNYISGWQIDGKANLYEVLRVNKNSDFQIKKIGKVDMKRFCRLLKLTQNNFLKIQALNAPGDSSHFIHYINKKTSTDLRAVWNVRFRTYGSTEFRALFDSLNLFLK